MHAHGGHAWVRMCAGGYNCGLGTGRSQDASLMVVVGRVCRPEEQKTIVKQDLPTRDKGGHSSHGWARGTHCESESPPHKNGQTETQEKKQIEREKREQTTRTDTPAETHQFNT